MTESADAATRAAELRAIGIDAFIIIGSGDIQALRELARGERIKLADFMAGLPAEKTGE